MLIVRFVTVPCHSSNAAWMLSPALAWSREHHNQGLCPDAFPFIALPPGGSESILHRWAGLVFMLALAAIISVGFG